MWENAFLDCKMDLVTSAIEDGNLSEVQLYLRMPFEFTSEEIDFLTLFCCRRFRLQLLHLFAGRSVLLAKQEEVFRSPAYLQGILSFLSFVKPSVSYWLEVFFPEESALIAAEQQAGLFFLGDHRGQDPQVLLLCFLEIMFSYMPPGRPSGKSPVSCKDAVPLYRPQLQELVKIHRHLGTFDPGFFVEDLGEALEWLVREHWTLRELHLPLCSHMDVHLFRTLMSQDMLYSLPVFLQQYLTKIVRPAIRERHVATCLQNVLHVILLGLPEEVCHHISTFLDPLRIRTSFAGRSCFYVE